MYWIFFFESGWALRREIRFRRKGCSAWNLRRRVALGDAAATSCLGAMVAMRLECLSAIMERLAAEWQKQRYSAWEKYLKLFIPLVVRRRNLELKLCWHSPSYRAQYSSSSADITNGDGTCYNWCSIDNGRWKEKSWMQRIGRQQGCMACSSNAHFDPMGAQPTNMHACMLITRILDPSFAHSYEERYQSLTYACTCTFLYYAVENNS